MSVFHFKKFDVKQSNSPQKVGTDAMILGALVKFNSPRQILDIGTGCGVIALMLAQQFQKAIVTGLDVNQAAIEEAHYNFENSPFKKRLRSVYQSFLSYQSEQNFDLIVSNPPFFEQSLKSDNSGRNLARHEQDMTLDELVEKAKSLLSKQGKLWLIIPSNRTVSITKNAQELGLFLQQRIRIFGKPNHHVRDVLVFGKDSDSNVKKVKRTDDLITIRDTSGNYSAAYRQLTKDFHWRKFEK